MPIFNGIQTSRLENFVRRLLAVRNGGILPTVAPELSVSVDLPQLEDSLALAGYIPLGAANNVAAVAAQFGFVSVLNSTPASLLVLQFTGSVNGASIVYTSMGPLLGGALIAATRAMWRDARRLPASFPLNVNGLNIQEGTLAAIPPGAHSIVAAGRVPQNTPYTSPWLVLPPGQAAACWADLANAAWTWQVNGYLRDSVPDELSGI